MAQKLVADGVNWFEDFEHDNSQSTPYIAYTAHLDVCLIALRVRINALVDEVMAVQGPNSMIIMDVMAINEAVGSQPANTNNGLIGVHSYKAELSDGAGGAGTSHVRVSPGYIIIDGQRYENTNTYEFAGSVSHGGPYYYIAVDANGQPWMQETYDQKLKDVYYVAWNGSAFTADPVLECYEAGELPEQSGVTGDVEIFMDGDAWYAMQKRPALGTFGADTFFTPDIRLNAIERALSGYNADMDGGAINAIRLYAGTAGSPFLRFASAVTVADTAGWYRSGADEWGFAHTTHKFHLDQYGITFGSGLPGENNAAVIRFNASAGAGFYWEDVAPVGVAVTHSNTRCMTWVSGQSLIEDGSESAPALAFRSALGTGVRYPGTNRLGFVTNQNDCGEFDAVGNLDLPLNMGVAHVHTASNSISQGSVVAIQFTGSAPYDIGTWHENVTNPDRFTVPTDGDGHYIGWAEVEFDEASAGGGGAQDGGNLRYAAITINGAVVAEDRNEPFASSTNTGNPKFLIPMLEHSLSAADIVRVVVEHDNGGTMDVDAKIRIQKVG